LHEQRNGSLVVEKAGLEEGEAGQHAEHQHGGQHDPRFIAVVKVGTAGVLAKTTTLKYTTSPPPTALPDLFKASSGVSESAIAGGN
jgi:hypothetical protein